MSDCLFCAIVAGEIPADIVRRSDRIVAFRDIEPQAPTHVLVIPVDHHADLASVAAADPTLVGELIVMAEGIAADEGLDSYRLIANTGAEAGQTLFHAHVHLLGGRPLAWPPG